MHSFIPLTPEEDLPINVQGILEAVLQALTKAGFAGYYGTIAGSAPLQFWRDPITETEDALG